MGNCCRQGLKTCAIQEIPWFVVMRLEEEIDECQLVYCHFILYAYRHGIDRLRQIHLGHNLSAEDAAGQAVIDHL
ncbi:hypothetical protein D3C75_935040 [compost metagenome]